MTLLHSVGALLSESSPRMRERLLGDAIRAELAELLGLEPGELRDEDRFMEIGIDSLKAVELKTKLETELGLALRSSLLFDYPSLNTLVPFLLKQLAPASAGAAGPSVVATPAAAASGQAERTPLELTDTDALARALAEEMQQSQALLERTKR